MASVAWGQAGVPAGAWRVEPSPRNPFPELDAQQAYATFRGGARFVDARLPEDFVYGHIPGALNLPLRVTDFEARLKALLASPQGTLAGPVVVYCSGCCSTDSLFLAQRLLEAGFSQVQVFKDGYPGWARAGYPRAMGQPFTNPR
ncbi:rhodanese-like domain-containing protein [Mesoterricola silvestris]|uniref:rhodanese-like domain-containing protein n=1 Tax=Mesoterricola silvestris TaxID=2927979 RepID=UPI00292D7686|nr:rhodanese-like domain-containing protein [Mesoterricola silvestris]